ncbi:MAG: APC family permease [Candidatus Roizmanbacteria bacterium]
MSQKLKKHEHPRLGQFAATAICGNDILSSSLYVSGIAIIFAGVFAPVVLAIVALVLFFYKKVYTEVVEALPINGGAYNCLLNGTSKTFAAIAGVMTILSYIATAVISAKVGVEYLSKVTESPLFKINSLQLHNDFIDFLMPNGHIGENTITIFTTILLLTFAILVISGIKDSAKVAMGIFGLHIITLIGFLILGGIYFVSGGKSYFAENLTQTWSIVSKQGGIIMTLYLAFSASLLGVSGFESSANFVEEQDAGVFRKTLRNMLIGVAIFNPLIALVVLNSMSFEGIANAKDFLLAIASFDLGGPYFALLVMVDAFLVLSGAVLTAYVGVSGLIYRMSADNCLPIWFLKMNDKGSYPRIIISFFILCASILIMTKGDLLSLAGVYTIAFLGVMSFFAFGNLILKETRTELKRTYNAPIIFVILAFFSTAFGLIGNIRIDFQNLVFFEIYFLPSLALIFIILYQDTVLKMAIRISKPFPKIYSWLDDKFSDIVSGKFIVFIHNKHRLHEILEYVNRNESGWNIILIHCKGGNGDEKSYKEIQDALPILKESGVFPHFNITTVYKNEEFGPELIDKVSKEFKVRKNRIMIGAIHHHHPYDYAELGGVRIIF